MVQVSPDTNNHSWDHTSGYQFHDDTIMGFSQNHLSGTGISDLGDILLQPFSGSRPADSFRSSYDRDSQQASPGYYRVILTDHEVEVELSASERVAFHRYTYQNHENRGLLLDFQHGVINAWIDPTEHVIDSQVAFTSDRRIEGYVETTSWVQHKTFFVMEFDSSYSSRQQLKALPGEKAPKFVLKFEDVKDNRLQVKVALSTVSTEGAERNLRAEIPDWDFDKVRADTERVWEHYLSKIEIEAPKRQKEIFYTGLYHLFLQPNNTADVDGRYRGFDDQIYQSQGDGHYSTFSLWDTFRAAHPLYTILVPEKVDDFVNSLIAQSAVQGFLPIWGLANKETYTMIGNHAIPVVVDAVLKGIPGIDPEAVYKAIYETSTISHKNSEWELYEKYGYYPFDKLGRDGESVSRTLESSVDDHAVALLAKELGRDADHDRFAKRALFYRNLFDAETGFMRGKDSNGQWRIPFDPLEATSPMNNPGDYTEANAWQYLWAAQHDTEGMIELFGSSDAYTAKLDQFFATETSGADHHLGQEAMIGQYAHGNEPSHHVAYLYALAGRPDKTRSLVQRIYNDFYDNTPDGIQGNEDCGQMSAWYVFSTLGFYPVDPVGGSYVLAEPQVERATIHLQNDIDLTIQASYAESDKKQSVEIELNGKHLSTGILKHQELMNGGNLIFNFR